MAKRLADYPSANLLDAFESQEIHLKYENAMHQKHYPVRDIPAVSTVRKDVFYVGGNNASAQIESVSIPE